jgi:SAM-dependent methyltransferase
VNDSTQGYAREAPELLQRYERYDFDRVHYSVLQRLPRTPSKILDIGAGTGRDAARFAEDGHTVVAVEPVKEMRDGARALHPSTGITWIDDQLPTLTHVRALGERFDLIWLSAVWMHLDANERKVAMATLAAILNISGAIMLTLRHGAVPAGRRMFEVANAEVRDQASTYGLRCTLDLRETFGELDKPGVSWTRLWFERT